LQQRRTETCIVLRKKHVDGFYQTVLNAVRGDGGNTTNREAGDCKARGRRMVNSLPADQTPNSSDGRGSLLLRASVRRFCRAMHSWGIVQYFWGQAYQYSGDLTRKLVAPEKEL